MGKNSIPHYINNPMINKQYAPEKDLYRPNISFGKSIRNLTVTLVATLLMSWISAEVIGKIVGPKTVNLFWKCFWISEITLCVLLFRFLLIFIIRIYQSRAKSETRLRCCFVPSCSEYAILCIRRYGSIIGGVKAIKRLHRCHPPGGIEFPYKIKHEKQLEEHLRKRIIKKICLERMPRYMEGTFLTLILSGFIENDDDVDNGKFQISILTGNCRELSWKIIITDEYFKVIECEQNEIFWSDMTTIHIEKSCLKLFCPGAKFIFPFSELDGVDMEKLRRAMTEIIKRSNKWNSPFTDPKLNFDELVAEKYAEKILKQLRSEIKNVYFYN